MRIEIGGEVTYDEKDNVLQRKVRYETLHGSKWGPLILSYGVRILVVAMALTFGAGYWFHWSISHARF